MAYSPTLFYLVQPYLIVAWLIIFLNWAAHCCLTCFMSVFSVVFQTYIQGRVGNYLPHHDEADAAVELWYVLFIGNNKR